MSQLNALPPSYYRLSGRFSLGGLVTAAAGTFAAALVLGAAYGVLGLVFQMIPITKLSFLLLFFTAFGFAAALAAVAAHLCKRGRVRNAPLTLLLAGAAGVLGLYTAWVFWIYALFFNIPQAPSLLDIAQPINLWNIVCFLNEKGVWSISGKDLISGAFLWVVWSAESATILSTILVMTRKFINAVPYCETCQKWGAKKLLIQAAPASGTDLPAVCLRKDFAALSASPPRGIATAQWLDLFLEGCADCDSLQCLTVERVVQTRDKHGKPHEKRKTVIRRMLLVPEETLTLAQATASMKAQVGT